MKKPSTGFAWNKFTSLIILLFLQFSLAAQLQWYQNQDGNDQPNGTYGTTIQAFGTSSFVACYLWTIDNDQYTWKISRTNINGNEMNSFFVSGTTTMADVKVGRYNTVYVLTRTFPFGQNPEYKVYKLNSNLAVVAQKSFSISSDFNIFNLNAFELDDEDNVYLAGDGQYPDGPGYSPASFVWKSNRNLVSKWTRIDSVATSYSRLHIESNGTVVLIEDYYTIFPNIRVTKISSNGLHAQGKIVETDANRLSLFSTLDRYDNLLLYGGKATENSLQAVYLRKLSRFNASTIYYKTHFASIGTELCDLKLDESGNIFALYTKNTGTNSQLCGVSRLQLSTGNVQWNRSIPFSQDSCVLSRLVINNQDRFYLVGERRGQTYYCKGYAIRMRKNGDRDGNFPAPDSIAFQRSHVLLDGIMDNDSRLIAIGNTNDFDTLTYSSSYYRAFAARMGTNNGGPCGGNDKPVAEVSTAAQNSKLAETGTTKLVLYPNPVQNELVVSNLDKDGGFDQLTVYDMQGVSLVRKSTNGSSARLDVSNLANGMYILYLRSSASLKEKSVNFVINR
jgi:Secretion system C-terminal sorting domain